MDEIERVATQLDSDKPNWFVDWADQRDLQWFARGDINRAQLRDATACAIILTVVNAAIWAGVVRTVD